MDTDFIIVGAGSSGCVLAHELSCGGRFHVTILEAGGRDNGFWMTTPLGYGKSYFDPAVNWMYNTEPDPGLNGRTDYWPRGKVLGGSSAINAMVYIRGDARDFDDWHAGGATGWSWQNVKPWFDHIENGSADNEQNRVHVSDLRDQSHELCTRFIAAGVSMGMPVNSDFNIQTQEGFGYFNMTIKDGRRDSAARAFLHPAMARSNVSVITEAQVARINFSGNRTMGVTYEQNGQQFTVRCRREVIVCAGAVNSPQLLQCSGVGPGELLRSLNIPVLTANDNIGGHLQDHLGINYFYTSRFPTMNNQLHSAWGKAKAGARYLLTRRGPLALSVNQAGAFVRTSPELDRPDVQVYFQPFTTLDRPDGAKNLVDLDRHARFAVGYSNCRPTSRGSIQALTPHTQDAPSIQPNSLSTEHDIQTVRHANRFIIRLCEQPSLANAIQDRILPAANIDLLDDDALLDDFRQRAGTVFHPVGTCRMGSDPATSVVSPELKVHGVEGLRVADASIYPNLISGNTNASAMMVGAKAADLIKREYN